MDELVEQAAERMWGVYPGYQPERFDRSELDPAIRANIELAVVALGQGRGPTLAELEPARALGATRADQSVPLESIIQAYRQTERVIVLDFLQRSREWPHEEANRATALLISVFDELTDAMIGSYRDTSSAREAARRQVEDEVVAALADGIDSDSTRFDRWIRLLDVDENGFWTAAALRGRPSDSGEPTAPQRQVLLRQLGPDVDDVICGELNNTLVLLLRTWDRRDQVEQVLASAMTGIGQGTPLACGLGTATTSLRTAAQSCRQALASLRVSASPTWTGVPVVDYRDVVVETMLLADPLAAEALYASRIAPLEPHPYLIETLEALSDNHLSQAATARRLFVHLNTIGHRLQRIREISGLDPLRFPDVLEFSLAIRWRKIRTTDPTP
ncbi:helix-turn-helix domain-containing protein [Saccharopolyspora sp. NFXS83]|uniref:PucR family transcriptional regulator n=1 Tax=Saccharopolyspora sp. NFXS83 TaxID=2993560 RepID=UPI00224A7309|nr:helix-turn-helix domain-containing protein [Saccharopolyspora sp. NFXS83]MCX2729288.1 helix-turn-helix domain-containing protein [Saccharopolyspora sp. NFXS83]